MNNACISGRQIGYTQIVGYAKEAFPINIQIVQLFRGQARHLMLTIHFIGITHVERNTV